MNYHNCHKIIDEMIDAGFPEKKIYSFFMFHLPLDKKQGDELHSNILDLQCNGHDLNYLIHFIIDELPENLAYNLIEITLNELKKYNYV